MTSRAAFTAGTTASAALILAPYSVWEPLPCHQVPMGVSGRATVYVDPFELYQRGAISNRNMAFVGQVGKGKSAAMKTFLKRMLTLPEELADGTYRLRRAVIIDRKPEYGPLTRKFGCEPVVVGKGNCLNPFDSRLGPQQHIGILESFLELLRRRPLDEVQEKCATVAYRQARAASDTLTLVDVRYALAHLTPESLSEFDPLPHPEVEQTAIRLAYSLDKLIDGSLAGMFDGPTTPTLDWAGQIVCVQVHPDHLVHQRDLVYQLLVAIVAVWLDQASQTGDPHRRIDFLVADEAWDYVKVRQFAALLQDRTKLGRSEGLCVLLSFQGPSDAESAGNVGEAQRDMAKRLLHDIGIFFLFNQSAMDARLAADFAQLTGDDVDAIENLPAHRYMLVLGSGQNRRRLIVDHRITGLPKHPGDPPTGEAAMVNSNFR